jgi:hypothetical protein
MCHWIRICIQNVDPGPDPREPNQCGSVAGSGLPYMLNSMKSSIGTEVQRYYCRARLFGSRLGLPCKNSSLGSESVPALSSCRMWTGCMINSFNCLRYSSYQAIWSPLWGEGLIPLLTLTLEHNHQHTTALTLYRPPARFCEATIKISI